MEFVLWLIIALLVGMILGVIATYLSVYDGVIRIDRSNPEKDIYRIDIEDIDKLSNQKWIFLKVDSNADLSQK